jgi:hypothetical protein
MEAAKLLEADKLRETHEAQPTAENRDITVSTYAQVWLQRVDGQLARATARGLINPFTGRDRERQHMVAATRGLRPRRHRTKTTTTSKARIRRHSSHLATAA